MSASLRLGGTSVELRAGSQLRVVDGGVIVTGDPVALGVPEGSGAFYRHGWQSWSETRWVDPLQAPRPNPVEERWPLADDPAHAHRRVHGGSALGAIETGDGNVLLLGAVALDGRVELDDGALVGRCEGAACEWFVGHGTEDRVFERYADLLADRFGGPRPRRSPKIWCSWYSFYDDIDERRMLDVLEDVRGLGFDSFQIDDGWQRSIGEWQANERFPSGMAAMASRIREAGFVPGLWIAPFVARSSSALYRDQPEMFVRDDDGAPVFAGRNWGGDCIALDVTHPMAQEFLVDLVESLVADGYGYLKLDFLYAAALPGRRHIDLPREHAYRTGVELLRRAAGDDVYLLACGAPIVPSLGVFDGIRVGPDVAPWWEITPITHYLHDVTGPNTRYAIATSLHRLWLQRVIETDPDVAYFRTRANLLDEASRRWLQQLALVARFRGTSDPPSWLDAEERAELVAFLDGDPEIVRLGRYRYAVDGVEVDFGPIAAAAPEYRDLLRTGPAG